jgi:flagella basal body P-ring formation protein FlgA
LNLAELQFSGSSQVSIAATTPKVTREVVSPLSMSAARKAKRRVAEAIEQYLRDNASSDHAWVVQVELDERQVRLLADLGRTFAVKGGKTPWVGPQRFELLGDASQGGSRFTVDAQVSVPSSVVVALHAMQRGGVIRAGDVELQEASGDTNAVTVCSLEEVIGRETTRAIPAGKVISAEVLRAPLLVRRGEAVTVYALSAGIRVRTTARARDDGSQGDLVAVESLLDRSRFFAVVSGTNEVEVYARSVRAEPDRK